MASKDMTIIATDAAGATTLPLYSTLQEKIDPIESKQVTLDGTLYTDFINNRRSWVVGWEKLKAADYDIIRAIYNRQYTSEAFPIVQIQQYGVTAPMKLEISDRNIRLNGEIMSGVSITLIEQYAVS